MRAETCRKICLDWKYRGVRRPSGRGMQVPGPFFWGPDLPFPRRGRKRRGMGRCAIGWLPVKSPIAAENAAVRTEETPPRKEKPRCGVGRY